ncbi:MAG: SDR family NAD(P)-dependent oxidoreductase, partial [Gallionella sp.]|nr:SDR family NAD(P)-dependent oxidoreductase [Gallionella sp.]
MRLRHSLPRGPARADIGERFGPLALVVGASQGLGAAWANALAACGIDLVLVARREDILDAFAGEVRRRHGVEVYTIVGDLGNPKWLSSWSSDMSLDDSLAERLEARLDRTSGKEPGTVSGSWEISFAVLNAAYAPSGAFLSTSPEALEESVQVNCLGALRVARALLPGMVQRGRGGLVLMSSLAGMQGSPDLAAYAATKAYLRVLAEGLWHEVRPAGVDVIACVAGAVETPGYAASTTLRAPG